MFAVLIANIIDAYRNPRASARALLSRRPTLRDAVLMVLLAFAIEGVFGIVISFAYDGAFPPTLPGAQLMRLLLVLFAFGLAATLAHVVGGWFGGKATLTQIAAVISWHAVVLTAISPISFLMVMAAQSGSGGAVTPVLLLVVVGVSIWLFASFIAEAHGFASVLPVIGVTFAAALGVAMIIATLLAVILGPEGFQPPA